MGGRLKRLSAFFLLGLAWAQTLSAAPPMTPVSVPFGEGADPEARGAARMVGNILEYTRWPTPPEQVGICVIGPTRHGSRLGDISLPDGTPVARYLLAPDTDIVPDLCNALYLGNLDPDEMQRWTTTVRGAPIVTIAENDPACRSEAMFCLVFLEDAMAFQLNIDAVSRSGVRIDPRVLRMSQGGYD